MTITPAQACISARQELEARARDGDREALFALVEHAREACRAIYRVWDLSTFMMVGDDFAGAARAEKRCRASLRKMAPEMTSFPVLHFADVNANDQTSAMLADLNLGSASPFKLNRRRADYGKAGASWLITAYIFPTFQNIQRSKELPWGRIEERIYKLPPLSARTAGKWIPVAADWLIELYGPQSTMLAQLARPEHLAESRKRESLRRIRAKYSTVSDCVGLTKKQRWLAKVQTRQATRADLKAMLRKVLAERMRSLLKK